MIALSKTDDYHSIFLDDIPLLDVRAPVEFARGAFPCAENHPLIDNQERKEIGITYKTRGADTALRLGERLVGPHLRHQRIGVWIQFIKDHPNAALYCFRGGQRSRIAQRWIFQHANINIPRITGGYKALRRFLIDEIETATRTMDTLVISGRTGVGKTRLLQRFDNMIDLEAIANHRGSAFGHFYTPQPTQINFENALSIALLKLREKQASPIIIEDESRSIGSVHIPERLFQTFKSGRFVVLEASLDERVDLIYKEYIEQNLADYQKAALTEEDAFLQWIHYLGSAFDKIKKRLGGLWYSQIRKQFEHAITHQKQTGMMEKHKNWIRSLLSDYYDPMYDYQINNKLDKICFQGNADMLTQWINEQCYGDTQSFDRQNSTRDISFTNE